MVKVCRINRKCGFERNVSGQGCGLWVRVFRCGCGFLLSDDDGCLFLGVEYRVTGAEGGTRGGTSGLFRGIDWTGGGHLSR
jgi:hypothetical protein